LSPRFAPGRGRGPVGGGPPRSMGSPFPLPSTCLPFSQAGPPTVDQIIGGLVRHVFSSWCSPSKHYGRRLDTHATANAANRRVASCGRHPGMHEPFLLRRTASTTSRHRPPTETLSPPERRAADESTTPGESESSKSHLAPGRRLLMHGASPSSARNVADLASRGEVVTGPPAPMS